jgi:hypothetical protein
MRTMRRPDPDRPGQIKQSPTAKKGPVDVIIDAGNRERIHE